MFRHYLKSAVRSFFRHRRSTLVNLLGLSIGMGACLVLLEYVSFERSFDGFHEGADDIYRVVNHRFKNGEPVQLGTITYPLVGYKMKEDFPEVLDATRLLPGNSIHVHTGDQEVTLINNPLYVDKHFFQLLSYPLLIGDKATAMEEAFSAVLSESRVRQLFGDEDDLSGFIGKSIYYNDLQLTLKGICADFPPNTVLQYNFFISYATFVNFNPDAHDSFSWSDFYHYLRLAPDTDVKALETKFDAFSQRYFNGEEVSGAEERFYLQPIREARLDSRDLEYELGHTSNGQSVWAMLLIAFFILILAWINYVNLATVRVIERSREVGVRKIVGARRLQLVGQFLSEAILINLAAFLLATQLAQAGRHELGNLLGVNLPGSFLWQGESAPGLLGLVLLTLLLGILATGAFPAMILSGFRMSQIIKGKFQETGRGGLLRKGLIVFQFAASIALMAGTMLVYRQISYMNQQDLGVAIDQTLVLNGPAVTRFDSNFIHRMNSFKGELSQITGVTGAATSSRVPGMMMGRLFDVRPSGAFKGQSFSSNFMDIDFDYADIYELSAISGRNFRAADHNYRGNLVRSIMLNEAAVELFGFGKPENAINEQLTFFDRQWDIIGVLPDFHQRSLQYRIEPIVFIPYYGTSNYISVKLEQADVDATLAAVKKEYETFFPGNAFNSFFLDSAFQRNYQAEIVFGKILLFFSLLAIVIACLGLFSLVWYATFLRTREIGIRKVLGASVASIVGLIGRDFLGLILLATAIAIPIAWLSLDAWLEGFACQTRISWWLFGIVSLLAVAIGLLTIGGQSLRTALANPAEAIRQEA